MLLLMACTPTNADLAAVLDANTGVLEGVLLGLEGLEVKLDRHSQGDGLYGYNGTLGAGMGWNAGQVRVVGESLSERDGALGTYTLSLDYVDVRVDGMTLNGTLAQDMTVITQDDGRLDLDYTIVGQLDVDGAWMCDLDYARDITPLGDADYSEVFSGTLNGIEVSSL